MRITERKAQHLSIDEVRTLVAYADGLAEDWNTGPEHLTYDLQMVLDLWWAAHDGHPKHWDGWQVFWEEDNAAARAALRKAEASLKTRLTRANRGGDRP